MRDHCKDTKYFLMHVHECMVYFLFLVRIEKKINIFQSNCYAWLWIGDFVKETTVWWLFNGKNCVNRGMLSLNVWCGDGEQRRAIMEERDRGIWNCSENIQKKGACNEKTRGYSSDDLTRTKPIVPQDWFTIFFSASRLSLSLSAGMNFELYFCSFLFFFHKHTHRI